MVFVAACTRPPAKHDQFPIAKGEYPVKVIAVLPGGGALADEVAAELARRGFVVHPPASTASMVTGVDVKGLYESHLPGRTAPGVPQSLKDQLHSRGVDALLIVKAEGLTPQKSADHPYRQSAFCYLYRTDALMLLHIPAWAWFNGDKTRAQSPAEAALGLVNAMARRSSP